MKILLTGASGFLGAALALHLRNLGHDVALLLRISSSLDRLRGREKSFEICRYATDGDIENFARAVDPDVVIHTACAYGRQGESLLQLYDANFRFGLVVLQALQGKQTPVTFVNTGTILPANINQYAMSKRQFAECARALALQSVGRLKFINVLLQHMYGPGDSPAKFTTQVLHACYNNLPELKLTLGEQRRDFIYIDDVVSAYATLIDNCNQLEAIMEIEIGSGTAPTVRQFVETVHRMVGSKTKLVFGALPYRANEVMHCQADITQMSKLGWHPQYDLNAGLKKTLEMEFGR